MALDLATWQDLADLTGGATALLLSLLVILAGRRSPANLLLGLLFLLLAISYLAPGLGLFADERTYNYRRLVYGWAATSAIGPVYAAFVGSALRAPLARPLSRLRIPLLSLAAAAPLILILYHETLFLERHPGDFLLRPELSQGINIGTSALLLYGLACAWNAYRHAPPGTTQERSARLYLLAFLTNDLGIVAYFATTTFTLPPLIDTLTYFLSALTLIVSSLILGRALLLHQLYDLDLKVKWTLRRGTLIAIFLAAYFITAAILEQWLQQQGVLLGGLAVGLLLFALRPLERAADRLANAAMPHVHDDPQYRLVRKHEVYRAAIESALHDGDITDKERTLLATLADQLGLSATETLTLERDARARRGGEG